MTFETGSRSSRAFSGHLLPILLIVVAGVFGSKALFHEGFYTSHDGEHQLARLYVFDRGLRDGQIPVRYSRQLYNGIGYPLFVFTYRFPFYVGELFRMAGLSYADSIKAAFVILYAGSGVAMYWFASRWGRWPGFVAALLYLFVPYRFSVMYVRAALGEHAAFVFAPLLFAALGALYPTKRSMLLGGAALAGLFLSHAMIVQILVVPLLVWSIAHFFLSAQKRQFVFHSCAVVALGLALSSYYVIPAFFYRRFIYRLNPFFFADHFVTLRQLIYSPWGFTFSMPGTDQDGMSFQIGVAQWAAMATAGGMMGFILLSKKRTWSSSEFVVGSVLIGIFSLSVLLMTPFSASVWNWWTRFLNIDIPWRFLFVTTLSLSTIAAWDIGVFRRRNTRIIVGGLLLVLALYGNRNHLRVNQYVDYSDERLLTYKGTTNSDNEYRPSWDNEDLAKKETPEALISTGSGSLSVIESTSRSLRVAVRSDEAIRLDFRILYFPGWSIFVDGAQTPFKYAGEGGIMRVDVPRGTHAVDARWGETPLMRIADGITIFGIAASGMIAREIWRERTRLSLS